MISDTIKNNIHHEFYRILEKAGVTVYDRGLKKDLWNMVEELLSKHEVRDGYAAFVERYSGGNITYEFEGIVIPNISIFKNKRVMVWINANPMYYMNQNRMQIVELDTYEKQYEILSYDHHTNINPIGTNILLGYKSRDQFGKEHVNELTSNDRFYITDIMSILKENGLEN